MIKVVKEGPKSVVAEVTITEANLSNSDQFKAELVSLLDQHHKIIVLDVQELKYVDSAFLGALVSSLKYAIALQLDIVLVGLRNDIRDLIKLIRLDKVFKIYNYSDEAIAAINKA
ncbi:MAG TPA: STAS domain-containing protein [Mucilaginibacter sp.]|nr:STAS domain-containing protein [Mucilaginibacter sp.]